MKNSSRIIIMIILVIPTSAMSQDNGNELYQWLNTRGKVESKIGIYNSGLADGFVAGVVEASPNICLPIFRGDPSKSEVTRGQIIDITVRFLESHPEQRHLSAALLVIRAISEKFPCAKR